MLHSVLQGVVAHAVPISLFNLLLSVACVTVDLLRRRERRLGRIGMLCGFFALYGHLEVMQTCPDRGLLVK